MLIVRGVPANQVGPLERRDVDRIGARRRQQRAAGGSRHAPISAGRQATARTALPPPACALHAVVDADRRRLDRAVVAREAQ